MTDKIEKTLQEVPYADKIRSYSKPGESLTILQVQGLVAAEGGGQQSGTRCARSVGDMRGTLPAGVIGPFFNDEFGDVYGSIFALSADGFSYEELRDHADDVRQRLLRVPDVAKVEIFGAQDEKLFVEISQKRLAQLGLDMNQVLAQLGAQNAVEGAGVLNAGSENLQVRVGRPVQVGRGAARAFRSAPSTRHGVQQLRLGDIAEIRRAYVDPPAVKVRHQGKEVIALGVSMAKGGDIIALGKALRARRPSDPARELPVGIELRQVQDQPRAVSRSVGEFVARADRGGGHRAGGELHQPGPALQAAAHRLSGPAWWWASRSRWCWRSPSSTMYYWGVGLHKISLGSLIIALGLLVDDAIIAVEMMVRKLEEGYDKMRAATFAYEVTAMPMLTGTLITAAGFLPIGMAKSATGEYTFAIFAVTAAALLISWLVSVYFVPYLGAWLLQHAQHACRRGQPHELFDTPFYTRFRAHGELVRASTAGSRSALTVLTFVLGIVGMGKVQQQFFPDSSRPEILVDLWLPEGTSIQQNEEVARRFEARMMKRAGRRDASRTWIGSGVPRFYLPLDQIFPQSNVSQIIVMPQGPERARGAAQAPARAAGRGVPRGARPRQAAAQRPAGAVPGAVPRRRARRGAGARVGRRGQGRSCAPNPNMRGVNDNWNESVKVLRLEVDQDKARALGVTSQAIAQASRTILSGTTIGQYREGDKLIDIVLRQPLDERNAITDIGNAYLPTASGRSDPADADRQASASAGSRACCGARTATSRSRCRATSSKGMQGADRDARSLARSCKELQRQACRRATASRWPARWRRAARARARSPPACR